jgi:type IV secretory pathway VirD2 relaxase
MGRPGPDARRRHQTYVVRMNAYGAKAASLHLGYIQRDGVPPDGSPGLLYGPKGPLRPEPFDEPRDGERHQFRIIISPDDGHELELTDCVRRVMARVERCIGRKLEWGAVNHHNTEHPHTHVVVRGVDLRGHKVRFDRAHISNGMRWRAQEIATEELGPWTEQDIRRTYEKEVPRSDSRLLTASSNAGQPTSACSSGRRNVADPSTTPRSSPGLRIWKRCGSRNGYDPTSGCLQPGGRSGSFIELESKDPRPGASGLGNPCDS